MDKPLISNQALASSAVATLTRRQKALDSKWFYDTRGSELFEAITVLPEYYPTRTEIDILRKNAAALAAHVPDDGAIVELGSGSNVKIRILLDAAQNLALYTPMDISSEFLHDMAADLQPDYPHIRIVPVAADFMAPISLPGEIASREKVVFFPGSTIGNLSQFDAMSLLSRIADMGHNGGRIGALILGADLVKDPSVLVPAYDDAAGVTAAFNINLLIRLNNEAGATFDPETFRHEARWNASASRIEMHLVSNINQTVMVGGHSFDFRAGESIHTENSHKYTRETLSLMAQGAGWAVDKFLTDDAGMFSVSVLKPT